MALELSNSQQFSSSYQVVRGELSRNLPVNMSSTGEPEDPESGGLIREHGASFEDSLRYRSRSSDGSSPPRIISPTESGADAFIDIKVSVS